MDCDYTTMGEALNDRDLMVIKQDVVVDPGIHMEGDLRVAERTLRSKSLSGKASKPTWREKS